MTVEADTHSHYRNFDVDSSHIIGKISQGLEKDFCMTKRRFIMYESAINAWLAIENNYAVVGAYKVSFLFNYNLFLNVEIYCCLSSQTFYEQSILLLFILLWS